MITRKALIGIDPRYGQGTPEQLASYVQQNYYSDYDPEAFRASFLADNATPTAEDYGRIDPAFRKGTKEQLFTYVKDTAFEGLDDEKLAEARAVFIGEAEDRSWGEVATDTGLAVSQGITGIVGGAGEMARMAPAVGAADLAIKGVESATGLDIPTTGEVGGYLSDKASEFSDYLEEYKSEGLRQKGAIQEARAAEREAEGQNWFERAGGTLSDIATDPALLGDQTAQSAAYLVPGTLFARGGAALATSVGTARNLAPQAMAKLQAKYASRAVAGGMGAVEGADAAVATRKKVAGMTHEQLMQGSEDYRDLIADNVNPDIAREMVALKATRIAFSTTAAISSVAGTLTSKFESGILLGKGSPFGPGLMSTGGTLLREGAEEIIQEGGNAFGGNLGIQQAADSSQSLSEGTAEAVGAGFIGGVTQTGVFKGIEAASNRLTGRQPEVRMIKDILERAKKGQPITEEEQQFVMSAYPEMKADVLEAGRAAAETEALAEEGEGLPITNGDVYDAVKRLAEQEGRDLTDAEKDFVQKIENSLFYTELERQITEEGVTPSAVDLSLAEKFENEGGLILEADAPFGFQPDGESVDGGMNYPELQALLDDPNGEGLSLAVANLQLRYELSGGGDNRVFIPDSEVTLSANPESEIAIVSNLDDVQDMDTPVEQPQDTSLTNGEVYEVVMRAAEQRGSLLPSEQYFLDTMGELDAPFMHQERGQEYVDGTVDFPTPRTLGRDNEGIALATALSGLETRYAAASGVQEEAAPQAEGVVMPPERAAPSPLVTKESQTELKNLNPIELAAYVQNLQEQIAQGEALSEYDQKIQGVDLAKLRAEVDFAGTLTPKFKTKAAAEAAAETLTEGRWEVVKNEAGAWDVQARDATALEAELESLQEQGKTVDGDWAARIIDPKDKAISTTEFKTEKGAKLSLVQKQKQHGGNWEVTTDGTKFYLSPLFVSPPVDTSAQVQSELFDEGVSDTASSSPVNSNSADNDESQNASSSQVTSSEAGSQAAPSTPLTVKDLTVKRAKDFATTGDHIVTYPDGTTEKIFRDTEQFGYGVWYRSEGTQGESAGVDSSVGFTQKEALQKLVDDKNAAGAEQTSQADPASASPVDSKVSLTQEQLGKIEIEMEVPTEDGGTESVALNAGVAYEQATDKVSAFEALLKCCKASR